LPAYPSATATFEGSAASKQLAPAASTMLGANDVERGWLKIIEVRDGRPMSAEIAEQTLQLIRMGWTPRQE
jgi:hypothetical protein